MESLLCNEVWLTSPFVLQEDDGFHAKNHAINKTCLYSTKQDCEEAIEILIDKESSYMPETGYLKKLNSNALIDYARFKAVYWIVKSQRRMNLSFATVFNAVNYLDRFISLTQCHGWKYWKFELLSIACLSVSSKFNETTTPPLHEFQVEAGLEHSFASTQIQQMELTLLKSLGWRMDCTTSFSYIELMISCIDSLNKTLVDDLISRVTHLLLNALLDLIFLKFHPCVIAMSAVKCTYEDSFPSTNNVSLVHLDAIIPQTLKDDLNQCQRIIKKLLEEDHHMFTCENSWHGPSSSVTVLKVEWYNFYNCRVDLSLLKMPAMTLESTQKRKREERECRL